MSKALNLAGGYLKSILGVLVFLLAWEIASRIGLINNTFIPPFSKVVVNLAELIADGTLFHHMAISLMRSLAGLGLGIGVGVPLGLAIGQIPAVERFLGSLLETLRQTSVLALIPVFILLLGLGETSKIAMIFWGTLWPILLSTIGGVKGVDPTYITASRSMAETRVGVFLKVILPAALPSIFTGVRLAATGAVMLLIAAEMVGASSGLGFLIYDYQVKYQIPKMFAVIAVFSIMGLVLNFGFVNAEKRLIRWRPE
ncbi:MAG: ABC transporter permease [Clostridiales Family XIII bacterium]|jgi:NitT/TauT family transport system permease protein|nr:ABC transporter permease [Clostridiales Family XIII bacterium]